MLRYAITMRYNYCTNKATNDNTVVPYMVLMY